MCRESRMYFTGCEHDIPVSLHACVCVQISCKFRNSVLWNRADLNDGRKQRVILADAFSNSYTYFNMQHMYFDRHCVLFQVCFNEWLCDSCTCGLNLKNLGHVLCEEALNIARDQFLSVYVSTFESVMKCNSLCSCSHPE